MPISILLKKKRNFLPTLKKTGSADSVKLRRTTEEIPRETLLMHPKLQTNSIMLWRISKYRRKIIRKISNATNKLKPTLLLESNYAPPSSVDFCNSSNNQGK